MADLCDPMHRADHCRAVKGFAPVPRAPLLTRFQLQIAPGQVVADGIAPDVIEGVFFGNVLAPPADHDNQLGLVVKVLCLGRIGYRLPGIDHRIGWLGEEERRIAVRVLAHLDSVGGVVAPNTEDTAHRQAVIAPVNGHVRRLGRGEDKRHLVSFFKFEGLFSPVHFPLARGRHCAQPER